MKTVRERPMVREIGQDELSQAGGGTGSQVRLKVYLCPSDSRGG